MKLYIFVNLVLLFVLVDNNSGVNAIIAPIPPRCPRIACRAIKCATGFVLTKLPTECCPSCRRDCSLVDCAQEVSCPAGQISSVPPGECCSRCQPNCSFVDCLQVVSCPEGQTSVLPPGGCCGQCVPITA